MAEDVWILGIHMTKFGKHPDKDTVDLAAEAAMGALGDAGVTMKDMGVLAGGNLMGAARHRPAAAEADRPDRHPGLQRRQRLRHRRHRAAHRGHGGQGRRVRLSASRSASRSWPGPGLLAGGSRPTTPRRGRRQGRSARWPASTAGIGTETMPGVFAQIGMEYGHKYGGATFELFARISEKNHAHSTLNPLAAYQKRFTLDQIMNDVMIAYPNTRPMCSANCDGAAAAVVVSDAKLKTLSLEQQRRAVKISASVLTSDPWEEACQVLPNVNTLTRNAAKQAYEHGRHRPRGPRPRRAARLLRHRRARPLRQPDALRARAAPSTSSSPAPPGATARPRSTCPAASSPRATRSRRPASPTSGRSATTCAVRPGDRQIEGAKVGLAHVIGLGSRLRRAHPGEVRRLRVAV